MKLLKSKCYIEGITYFYCIHVWLGRILKQHAVVVHTQQCSVLLYGTEKHMTGIECCFHNKSLETVTIARSRDRVASETTTWTLMSVSLPVHNQSVAFKQPLVDLKVSMVSAWKLNTPYESELVFIFYVWYVFVLIVSSVEPFTVCALSHLGGALLGGTF